MDATRKMINKDAIEKMKDHVVILNFARDLLVDEEAVLEAIDAGKVHRYVSDFPNPTTVGKKGVIVTPHLGASTAEAEDNCAVMAVKELKSFLENGTIRNSVNYPNCDLGVCQSAARLAIFHKNIKKMISQFTDILSDTNIQNMSNTSKGDYAYTLLDLDAPVTEEAVQKLREIEGVIRIRVVK
jgi:D-3-phosphoglycerate dehydrogenase